ncbi:MAG: MGMT family protein [Verrucomicrobia subdivision 3 bacterium]|nr:MGMT family protein [Limisphaerales bacterium]
MAYVKKSWREKLADDKDLPKIFDTRNGKVSKKWGEGLCAIPRPRDVAAFMQKVRKGKLTTINELRAAVAAQHGADFGCPITTGIFAWIAAQAAEEALLDGRKRVTPYWRTLKTGGEVNPKYPGGVAAQRKLLEAEGHKVLKKGKRYLVADFESRIETLIANP